jgi:hypothetical protein
MKILFRILAVFFVLLLVVLVAGYFTLTNAGFQKRIVEQQLPEGSSVDSIHVTTGKVTLSGLTLLLDDGTRIEIGTVDTPFDLMASIFNQTIKMGEFELVGLRVDLPTASVASASSPTESGANQAGDGSSAVPTVVTQPSSSSTVEEASTNPMDALQALGNFDWLLDIDGIHIDGVIDDGKGSQYVVQVDSPAIRPGASSEINATLQLLTDAPLPSGVKSFDSTATLRFKQKQTGGFESLQFESKVSGADAQDRLLLTVEQTLDLEVDDAAGEASAEVSFYADFPMPEVLVPELASLGAFTANGHAAVRTDGVIMTVSDADLMVSAGGVDLVNLDLKRSMVIGGDPDLSGELLDVVVQGVQLEWLNPWLSGGLQLQSQQPVSFALSVAGGAEGALLLTFAEPLQLGPFTVTDAGSPLVQDLSLVLSPEVEFSANQLKYTLSSLSIADRYGAFVLGSSSGIIQLDAPRDAANPFTGMQVQTKLQIGLQELFQQPVLADSASIVSGQLVLDVRVDESAEQPLQLEAQVLGLRASSLPTMSRDYSLTLGLSHTPNPNELEIVVNALAGASSRPSTDLLLSAVVNPSVQPVTFIADVSSPRVTQEDLSILSAAFTPRETSRVESAPTLSQPATVPAPSASSSVATHKQTTGVEVVTEAVPPAWAMLDGRVSVSIDELRLEAGQMVEAIQLKGVISEPTLSFDPISAKLGDALLNGKGSVLYAAAQSQSYRLNVDVRFSDLDPSYFVKQHETVPVQGEFDGHLQGTGAGESLDAAIEDSQLSIKVTGEKGVLTAFEMDDRKQLGLGLAGLIGQSLDRPGIAALSNTIPYFKNIEYDSFVFELNRGEDKRFVIPELRLTGESLLLDASGAVGASQLSEVMSQPIDLKLQLGAKGKLAEYLEILDLLQPTTAADGFTRWNQDVQITGTLEDPNTDALMDLLNAAAKGALSKKKKTTSTAVDSSPSQSTDLVPSADSAAGNTATSTTDAPVKKSKDEKRRDDIEMGLDLLNSFLGN